MNIKNAGICNTGRLVLLALVSIFATGCVSDPAVVVRNNDPSPAFVAPACWEVCEQSPVWVTESDGTGDWDVLGASQSEIERQKAACEASRRACADALIRLRDHQVIVIGGKQ